MPVFFLSRTLKIKYSGKIQDGVPTHQNRISGSAHFPRNAHPFDCKPTQSQESPALSKLGSFGMIV
ncbi:hypothetical protein [Leptospira santarosai]|uniref:hypothetical protein n=1 Tax=Leptospira santarosai TaxID=28183 RepID=UPI0002BF4E41|nr:hypothetical protein [Leptospira santarosai]EMO84579.1 hypothetical protein LEP1GSC070_3987 [Leptospira santarosai str. AIM]MDI7237496.1 hypothetical protein [Leptospira santarosai]